MVCVQNRSVFHFPRFVDEKAESIAHGAQVFGAKRIISLQHLTLPSSNQGKARLLSLQQGHGKLALVVRWRTGATVLCE
jgi:hypothetical protein